MRDDGRPNVAAVRRLRDGSETPASASSALTPEVMADASRRLAWLGLVYAIGVTLGYFGRRALLDWAGDIEGGLRGSDLFTLAGILMGVVVYVVSSRGLLTPRRQLDLGLAFQVVGAFSMSASEYWQNGLPSVSVSVATIPAECAWIIVYPLVVPNTPRKVLLSSLLAASMGPATFAIASATGRTATTSLLSSVTYFMPSYLGAVTAYTVACVIHRFNVRLKHAREIGSYELVERIGEGGMGEVWRARHRLLARPAALKLIRSDLLGSSQRSREAIVSRFEREAQATAMLGSTHTVDVYDFGVTDEGDFYYVMELLDGVSLERYVRLFGPMEPARTVRLLTQVCHSLSEAHARGLVHRDIKPANIFVCRLGPDYDFVKVLDFGLVKHVDPNEAQALTVEGVTAGTPAYMAPEIALGRADVDGQADLYSLGCVAYFLLTGQPVFSRGTAMATALAHVNDEPAAPSTRSELAIPPALDALVLECLAKEPSARPESADVVAARLTATVPAEGWTADAARAWWNLHGMALAAGPTTTS